MQLEYIQRVDQSKLRAAIIQKVTWFGSLPKFKQGQSQDFGWEGFQN